MLIELPLLDLRLSPSRVETAGPCFDDYDFVVIGFSGGKDSLACLLHILDEGVPASKIELWHHEVDGREGSDLMDWPCTPAYCRAVAKAFGVRVLASWKVGGLEGEMMRLESRTAPTRFETLEGEIVTIGGDRGKLSTRRMFPQVSADLSVRYCSAYTKIDPAASALRNQSRFRNSRTLFVTGERAEESASRAQYATFLPHKADRRQGAAKRHIDHWRPVHAWSEHQVWEIIKRYRVNPHVAYRLGFGRCSCMKCIFGSPSQWASVRAIHPSGFQRIADLEDQFGKTIHRTRSVVQSADLGTPYSAITDALIAEALSEDWDGPVFLEDWSLPAGAFGDSCGPT